METEADFPSTVAPEALNSSAISFSQPSLPFPAFSEEDKTKNPEHYSPKLDFGANLISKNYITTTDEDEHRLEKNVGFHYSYNFWSPRLFGFRKTSEEKKKEKEAEKEKK